ncbi:RDD family protein [Comamonas aquatica]|uniref:RDD family protein n=1 Tax=Comamonas aquatica TaxID=225991 RepID=UPI0005AADFA8|nr:RDD family protein [Comamonas aquatica]
MNTQPLEYAGFWTRTGAALIDGILLLLITLPLLISIYGWEYLETEDLVLGPADFLISWVLPAFATVLFWLYKKATPGKMAVAAQVVDAQTGATVTVGQAMLRYLGYFIAMLPLGLGIFWIGFDRRKQGWHDKIAGTVVVKRTNTRPEPVRFN